MNMGVAAGQAAFGAILQGAARNAIVKRSLALGHEPCLRNGKSELDVFLLREERGIVVVVIIGISVDG
jgi:hypothetical protein